jgi:hypothetical protein
VVIRQTDVAYASDPEFGLVPKGWKTVENFHNGEFDRSLEATVVTAKVNHPVADDRFVLDFPVNTLVTDGIHLEGTRPQRYIVRPNGGKRLVLEAEYRKAKTPEELIQTETGGALIDRQRGFAWGRWFLALLVIGGVIAVVAAGIHRSRKR